MEERRPRAAPKPGVCVELAETAAAISMLALGQDLPMGQVQFFFSGIAHRESRLLRLVKANLTIFSTHVWEREKLRNLL